MALTPLKMGVRLRGGIKGGGGSDGGRVTAQAASRGVGAGWCGQWREAVVAQPSSGGAGGEG
jgi:hypothetical protein